MTATKSIHFRIRRRRRNPWLPAVVDIYGSNDDATRRYSVKPALRWTWSWETIDDTTRSSWASESSALWTAGSLLGVAMRATNITPIPFPQQTTKRMSTENRWNIAIWSGGTQLTTKPEVVRRN